MNTEYCDSCSSYWHAENEEPPCKGCIYAVAGCRKQDNDLDRPVKTD